MPEPGLEIVWHGARPRLCRKLAMGTAVPEPDFDCASSRARSTARRLQLQRLPDVGGRSSPSGFAPARAPKAPTGARSAPPTSASKTARTKRVEEREWIAPDQLGFLELLASKRQEMAGRISERSRDDARSANVANLSHLWRSGAPVEPLSRLQLMTPNVAIEGVLLQKLDRQGAAGAEDPRVFDLEAALERGAPWR